MLGKGVIVIKSQNSICDVCEGTGICIIKDRQYECPACHGCGYVTKGYELIIGIHKKTITEVDKRVLVVEDIYSKEEVQVNLSQDKIYDINKIVLTVPCHFCNDCIYMSDSFARSDAYLFWSGKPKMYYCTKLKKAIYPTGCLLGRKRLSESEVMEYFRDPQKRNISEFDFMLYKL